MFQYAMARAISIRLKCDFKLNTNRVTNVPLSRYNLCLWKGVNNEITSDEPNKIIEQDLPYNLALVSKINKESSLLGYWQTEKYFSEIKGILQEEFKPREPLNDFGIEMEKRILEAGDRSVFLTVRRTDYVTSTFHGVLSMDYYHKAISYISDRVKDPVIFVFSDEPEWCKENLHFPHETIIAGNYDMSTPTHMGREDQELWLMIQCKHAIMANSSYSWWGAWLNDTGIVIGPKNWFLGNSKDHSDIMPSRWIKI
jgi:hypothetical protein